MVAAIRTVGLAKSFGATVALRPLDLEVAEGEVLGYLGPNGAGKTTTIRCLLGMERASAGRAEIFGVDARAHPAEAHRRRLCAGGGEPVAGADRRRGAAPAGPRSTPRRRTCRGSRGSPRSRWRATGSAAR